MIGAMGEWENMRFINSVFLLYSTYSMIAVRIHVVMVQINVRYCPTLCPKCMQQSVC